MNSNIVMVIFIIICTTTIHFNLIEGKPVDNKRNSNNKKLIGVRRTTKAPLNNDYMPMASMQMINRNAMMHNKFGNKQQQQTTKTTRIPVRTTINPLCTTQIIPIETTTRGVRPNTIFTSYNWLPSR